MKRNLVETAVMILAALTALWTPYPASGATARSAAPGISFDNPYIPAGQAGSRYLSIDIEAPGESLPGRSSFPLNLVMVVDRSGSMAAARKMDYVKRTAVDIISYLGEDDTFALVVFDDTASVVIPSERVNYPGELAAVIEGIYPGGSTNLGDGLARGYEQAGRHFREEAVNRLILLTDGLANRGLTDPAGLSEMVAAESEEGIFLSTFGVGLDYNEDLLASLADAGRGRYHYVASPSQIPDMLSRELGQAQAALWLDVTVTILIRGGCRLEKVLGLPYRMESGRSVIHLGDIPAGARRQVLVKIDHPAGTSGRLNVGEVSLSFRERGQGGPTRLNRDLSLQVTPDALLVRKGFDAEVQKKATLALANEEMDRAARLADKKQFREARQAVGAAQKILDQSPVRDTEFRERQEMLRGYSGKLAEAPAMAPAEINALQKKTKFDIYRNSR